jgi:hypothetical protein
MKAFALLTFALLASPSAFAFDLQELAGKYKVTHPDFPVETIITLDTEGKIRLDETSPMGEGVCEGTAVLDGAVLRSSVTCDNGRAFTQEIDLRGVSFFSPTFRAPVYSSLYKASIVMDFRRWE